MLANCFSRRTVTRNLLDQFRGPLVAALILGLHVTPPSREKIGPAPRRWWPNDLIRQPALYITAPAVSQQRILFYLTLRFETHHSVVARSPDRATWPDRRSPGSLESESGLVFSMRRTAEWHAQETVPQRGELAETQIVW